ncbi:hypothetical protein ID866_12531, partial [Astraeus odoratus]
MEELETRDTIIYTLVKTESNTGLEIIHSTIPETDHGSRRRLEAIIDLTKDFSGDLPPMRIILAPHDNPSMHTDWRIKSTAMEAARSGKGYLPAVTEGGWIQACPPDSPARLNPPALPHVNSCIPMYSNATLPKTFIASHRLAMDPCQHPELLVTHGQFISHNSGPLPQRTMIPRFSHCGTLLHHDIRPPIPYGWTSGDNAEEMGDVPWPEKVDERLDWRGSMTGIYASPDSFWMHSHRQRLVALTNTIEGNVSVLDVPADASMHVGQPRQLRMARVNPAWTDVAFTGKPIACDEDAGTCDLVAEAFEFRRSQVRREEGKYKFILDVDGNGWSGRFKRLITSHALIFKAT